MNEDLGKATIDLLHATKAIVERDLGLGFITPERLRFTIEARKEEVKRLSDAGLSQRQIAAATGVSPRQVRRDLGQNAPDSGAEGPSDGSQDEPSDNSVIKEVLTKVATDLYDEQNCKARLAKLQFRAGKGLLELRSMIEGQGENWWEWYEQRNLRPKREAERLMAAAQREMEE